MEGCLGPLPCAHSQGLLWVGSHSTPVLPGLFFRGNKGCLQSLVLAHPHQQPHPELGVEGVHPQLGQLASPELPRKEAGGMKKAGAETSVSGSALRDCPPHLCAAFGWWDGARE